MTRLALLCLLPLVLAPALQAATGDEAKPPVTRRDSLPIRLTIGGRIPTAQEVGRIASASFWMTRDRGATWTKALEVTVAEDATEAPVYHFVAEGDGTYGFRTAIVYRDAEPEAPPVAGETIPTMKEMVTIDTTPPHIDEVAVVPGETGLTLRWTVSDPHLDPAPTSIERQAADGSWTSLVADLPAQGSTPLDAAPGDRLRLVVRDSAGNLGATPAWTIPAAEAAIPPAADAATPDTATGEEALAQAISELPPADGVEQVDPPTADAAAPEAGAPEVPAPPADPVAAAPVPAAGDDGTAPPATGAATGEAAAAVEIPEADEKPADEKPAEVAADPAPATRPRPVVPPGHQDIIAPNAESWVPPTSSGPGAQTSIEIIPPAPTAHTDVLAPPPAHAVAGDGGRGLASSAAILANLPTGALLDHDAELALAAARNARAEGADATAMALYRRLRDSRMAAETILEEIALYRSLDRVAEAVRIAVTAPPEARSAALGIAHARCLLDLQDHGGAESVLRRIAPDGETGREARLLLARALLGQGRQREATILLDSLATGDDNWAEAARALRGQ